MTHKNKIPHFLADDLEKIATSAHFVPLLAAMTLLGIKKLCTYPHPQGERGKYGLRSLSLFFITLVLISFTPLVQAEIHPAKSKIALPHPNPLPPQERERIGNNDIPINTQADRIKPDPVSSDHAVSLPEALTIADRNNPQLIAAQKNIDIAKAGIGIAREIPNPTLSAESNFGQVASVVGNTNSLAVSQTVETDFKRHKRTVAAKSQYKLAIDQFNATRWSVREQTRQAYAAYAAAMANKAVVDEMTESAQKLLNIAQARFDAGAAPKADVVQARLALSQTITQKIQALSQIKQTRLALNTLLGKPLLNDETAGYTINDYGVFQLSARKTAIIPLPETPSLDANPLYGRALKNRPDLVAAIQQTQANADQLKVTQAQRYPDLQLSGGWYYSIYSDKYAPIKGQTFYSGIFGQVGITVPVFHNQGAEIAQAKSTLSQSQLQVQAIIRQIQNDIRTAYLSYEQDRATIGVYHKTLLPDAKQNLYLAQESYKYGKSPLANVILAQQNYQQIVQSYLQTVSSFQTDWGNLEQAVGEPLSI